ncbi:MAG: HEAT repeat domain-containing protein [Planctomycetota bacterium]|jgi:HEAT repeat protein|nr:HEAT repeat domain-containing protein [Planctomycetota bacterium]MDP6940888.1 HEAT repeat domain-containing protein [Planctomycetota bacterium]
MLLLCLPALSFAILPQERPLIRGAYRGPYDEVLAAEVASRESTREAILIDGWNRWEFWFEYERSNLFQGKSREQTRLLLPNGNYGLGEWRLSREQVLGTSLPLLHKLIESPFPEVREASALSIGRIGDSSSLPFLLSAAEDSIAQVRQAALLGLGLLDNDRALVYLGERFSETKGPINDQCFAAIGMGLSGRKEAAELLRMALERNLKTDRLFGEQERLLLATIWGAGLQGSEGFVPALVMGGAELSSNAAAASRRVRSLICWALGAIGDSSSRGWLVRQLRGRDPALQRAAAQAISSLGDTGAIPVLAEVASAPVDLQTRILCLLAIGQLGGETSTSHLEALAPITQKHRQLQAAWGIAVGLSKSDALIEDVFNEFISKEKRDPWEDDPASLKMRRDEERLRGALALGLAFHGDQRTVEQFSEAALRKGGDPDFVGYLCIALGYLGGEKAAQTLKEVHENGNSQADSRRGLALGWALLNTEEGAVQAAKMVIGESNASVRLSAARSLALTHSAAAQELITNELKSSSSKHSPADVAHMVLALGFLGDPYQADRLSATVEGLNYRQEFSLLRALSSY